MAQGGRQVSELLAMAIAEPSKAEEWARRLLASETDPGVLSMARQALGVVLRDRGMPDQALTEMRTAVHLARRTGDIDRESDARATLGLTLAIAGRTRAGLTQLERARSTALDATTVARILMRRGHLMYFLLTRPHDALQDLEKALPIFRDTDDRIWTARTLNLVGLCQIAVGRADLAAQAVREAEEIFTAEGQDVESVVTLHNRGWIAWCQGNVPVALRLYDEAADGYAALGEDYPLLVFDRCQALLAVGLASEAVDLAIRRIQSGSLEAVHEAELLLTLADAELAAGDHAAAVADSARARGMFRTQRRPWWALRAELASLLGQHGAGDTGRRLVRAATSVARGLDEYGSEEAAVAWLLAGRFALSMGSAEAGPLLDRAAANRKGSSGLARGMGWQARALQGEVLGDGRMVLASCRRGLASLDELRGTLGGSELRALVTQQGDELVTIALRHAVHGGPRPLLEWSERWRATALTQPPVHPPDDDELARDLAALRDTRRRLAEAQAEASPTAIRLDEERGRLERAIRQRTHHLAGTSTPTLRFRAEHLVDSLADTTFVELVDIDGVLHALVARSGRVTHVVVGAVSEAEQAVAFARFALRQAARGRPADLQDVGRRLESALLGDAVRRLGGGPVVISPTSRLHATPWSLLPSLERLPVSVAPSAALWLRAKATTPSEGGRVLVAGPGLESGGAEIDVLASRHPEAVLLKRRDASVERALAVMDGAAVVHVAAHGHFRDDSPMFSSLDLDDGPLTVHDFERLDRAPHRIVLSACESGVVAPIGAGEMLGLVSAMLAMGSAGIVSSVAKVNDRATADLMLDVHAAMDDGEDLGHVLLRAREAARGDRVREATAAAFLAMGV